MRIVWSETRQSCLFFSPLQFCYSSDDRRLLWDFTVSPIPQLSYSPLNIETSSVFHPSPFGGGSLAVGSGFLLRSWPEAPLFIYYIHYFLSYSLSVYVQAASSRLFNRDGPNQQKKTIRHRNRNSESGVSGGGVETGGRTEKKIAKIAWPPSARCPLTQEKTRSKRLRRACGNPHCFLLERQTRMIEGHRAGRVTLRGFACVMSVAVDQSTSWQVFSPPPNFFSCRVYPSHRGPEGDEKNK